MTPDLQTLSDERLITDYQRTGNEVLFEIVYKRRVNLVRQFIQNNLPETLKNLTSDLVQEVFLRLHSQREDFAHGFKVSTWLFQQSRDCTVYLIRYRWSAKRNNGRLEIEVTEDAKVSSDDQIEEISQREVVERIRRMVPQLPTTNAKPST